MDENKENNSENPTPQEQAPKTSTPLVNNTVANPYKDQQYLPGQTIGYGLPTDQKVINYSESNKPVRDYTKLKRRLLILTILIVLAAGAYFAYVFLKNFISS